MVPEPAVPLVDDALAALRSSGDELAPELRRFLRDAREGLLSSDSIVDEARLWHELIGRGWPGDRAAAAILRRAVDALTRTPSLDEPEVPEPFEPINDLERAVAAAADDPWQRPDLWRALHAGEVVLPVLAFDLRPEQGLSLRFLTMALDAFPLVVGFTAEERFDALLGDDTDFPRVLAPGPDLPQVWPAGHALQLNPGYDVGVVVTADEILHLPHGPAALRAPTDRRSRGSTSR